jgi:GNAT superfamily N-acetyltransferase
MPAANDSMPESPDHGVELSLRQFQAAWRAMIAPCPTTSFGHSAGLSFAFSGLPVPFFNVAFLTDRDISADALSAQATAACAWAASKGVPWFLIVTNENVAPGVDAAAVLDDCGLVPAMPLTGMAADVLEPARPLPDDLQLTVPGDEHRRSTIVEVNSAAYGMDLSSSTSLIASDEFWRGHVPVVGMIGGKCVSCAGVLMVEEHRYVALVATEPAYQRRGFGDAVMRHALDTAAQQYGPSRTVLHATDAGRPVYERMGYRPIATHTLFMDKAAAGH